MHNLKGPTMSYDNPIIRKTVWTEWLRTSQIPKQDTHMTLCNQMGCERGIIDHTGKLDDEQNIPFPNTELN